MKNFLGINWKVRVNNPQFWLAIVLAIVVPPLAYTGIEFSSVTSWGKLFSIMGQGFANPYVVVMMIVSIYNAISDKTTKGFGDTAIAKQYLRPRSDKDPKYALDWEVNIDKKTNAKLQAEEEKQAENSEVVDGINGTEISQGDVRDEIELNNQTAEDTFGDVDNEIFGDSAEPQNIGNDTDEEYREKQADADIRGTDIRG
ncbi:phage holin family protein [Staphylococcus cohnii species complex 1658]|uniref:phage holin family protein n=1 Tax=Staphylococcus cohnii species complex 1658 TaxID=3239424 RepID=UPI0034D96CFA